MNIVMLQKCFRLLQLLLLPILLYLVLSGPSRHLSWKIALACCWCALIWIQRRGQTPPYTLFGSKARLRNGSSS